MHHKAIKLAYGAGTTLELTFQDGQIKPFQLTMAFAKGMLEIEG